MNLIHSQNKIALVTGGSRGIGQDIVLNLAKSGYDVILTYKDNAELAGEVMRQIEESGRKAAIMKLDIGDVESFHAFFNQLIDILKCKFNTSKIDCLVNNAGIGMMSSVQDVTTSEFDELMAVNFKGPLFFTQGIMRLFNDEGCIINISTNLTRFTYTGFAIYASMKSALETLSIYKAKELGHKKIRVNIVAPGAIETDFGGGHVRDNSQLNKSIAEMTALGRVGLPSDIGPVVSFLCSDQAKWINGQRIEVSGGIML